MATIVYGKPNCVYCDRAKRLLNGLNIDFDYKDVSLPGFREELLELVPSAKTVPQIWLHDSYIGGYDALVTFLETAKKNPVEWDNGNYGQGRI